MTKLGYGAVLLLFYCNLDWAHAQEDTPSELIFVIYDEEQQPIKTKLLPYQFYTDTFHIYAPHKAEMDSLYKNHKEYSPRLRKGASILKQKLLFGVFPKSTFLSGYHLLADTEERFLIAVFYGYDKHRKNTPMDAHWSCVFEIIPNAKSVMALALHEREKELLPASLKIEWYYSAPNFIGLFVFPLHGKKINYKGFIFGAAEEKRPLEHCEAVVEIFLNPSAKSEIKQVPTKITQASTFEKQLFFKL